MIRKLFVHQWKSYWRSPERGENIISFISMGVLFLLLAFYALAAGYYLPDALKELAPNKSPVVLLNQGLIYFIAFSFLFRIFFQGFPTQAVEYYRSLPVKRSTLINILQLKNLTNVINIIFVLFLVPFTIKAVFPEHSLIDSLSWLFSIILLELCNGFITFLIKKKIFTKPTLLLPILILLITVLVMEFLTSLSVSHAAFHFFNLFITTPVFFVLPFLLSVYLYLFTYRWLDKNFYPEDLRLEKGGKVKSYSRYGFLENFGEVGSYIALELKMIFRNKRPRALLLYSLLFFVYPLIFYKSYFNDKKPVYPKPVSIHESAINNKTDSGSDQCKVTFSVQSNTVPKEAYVYVYGSDIKLGGNEQDSVNLYEDSPGKWSRTFLFEKGRVIEYNFSLGSSNSAALDSSGKQLSKSFASVWNDTTINVNIAAWKIPQKHGSSYFIIVFWTIFLVSYTALTYGQYLFAWEGGYFDFILSQKINIKKYIEAKYYMMSAAGFIAFGIMLIYIYMSLELLWLDIAALFYGLGVNAILTIFMGTFNRKQMDLRASMISQQGRDGIKQFLRTIPMLLLMVIIYFGMILFGLQKYLALAYGIVGLIGLLFHKQLMNLSINNFEKNRYKMAVGFREK